MAAPPGADPVAAAFARLDAALADAAPKRAAKAVDESEWRVVDAGVGWWSGGAERRGAPDPGADPRRPRGAAADDGRPPATPAMAAQQLRAMGAGRAARPPPTPPLQS